MRIMIALASCFIIGCAVWVACVVAVIACLCVLVSAFLPGRRNDDEVQR